MLLLLYEEQRQPSSFTILVSISSTRTHKSPKNITYRAAVADLNAYVGSRAPVVRLPITGNLAPGHIR